MPATARLGHGELADCVASGSAAVAGMARSYRKTTDAMPLRRPQRPRARNGAARTRGSGMPGSVIAPSPRIPLRCIQACMLLWLARAGG